MTPNTNNLNQPDPASFRGFLNSLKDGRSEFRECLGYWLDLAKQIFRDFVREQTREKLSVFTFSDTEAALRISKEVADAINIDPLCEYGAEVALPHRESPRSAYYAPYITVTKDGAAPLTGAIVISHDTFRPCGIRVDGRVLRISFAMPVTPAERRSCECCGQAVTTIKQ